MKENYLEEAKKSLVKGLKPYSGLLQDFDKSVAEAMDGINRHLEAFTNKALEETTPHIMCHNFLIHYTQNDINNRLYIAATVNISVHYASFSFEIYIRNLK